MGTLLLASPLEDPGSQKVKDLFDPLLSRSKHLPRPEATRLPKRAKEPTPEEPGGFWEGGCERGGDGA